MTCHQVGNEVAAVMQDGDGVEPGSGEEDAGMYAEELYAEQHEYPDDPAGVEGPDVDADNDQQDSELQGSDMQTEALHQEEDEFAGDFAEGSAAELDLGEGEVAEGDLGEGDLVEEDLAVAEGHDDDGNEAEAPTDEPVSAQSCLQLSYDYMTQLLCCLSDSHVDLSNSDLGCWLYVYAALRWPCFPGCDAYLD